MLKTFEILLDIEKDIYTPANILFSVSRNDFDSVELQFSIIQDSTAFDLTGKTIEIGIKKPSGLVVYQPVEIRDALAGKAAARLSLQAYMEFGLHVAEVYIREEEQMAVTSPFYYFSREAIIGDEEQNQSVDDWSALQQVLFSMDKKPILTEGVPEEIPAYIGQMAFDIVGKRAFIANDITATGWQLLAASEGGTGGGIVYWADIIGKPAAFPAEPHEHDWTEITGKPESFSPEIHQHDWTEITGKPAAFPAEPHQHEILDVNGLQAALDSKSDVGAEQGAPVEHTHAISDVTGLQPALDGKADDADLNPLITEVEADGKYALKTDLTGKADLVHTHDFNSITGKPAAYPPEIHTHDFVDIQGKPATYPPDAHTHDEYLTQPEGDARYALRDAEGGTIQSVDWGTITGEIANQTDLKAALDGKADDADLTPFITETDADLKYSLKTDAPVEHGHTKAEIEGLQAEIDAINAEIDTKANIAHNHAIVDVTGLQAALDGKADDADLLGKADAAHSHTFAAITEKPATYPPEVHQHGLADVTGLQAALDGKADDADLNGKADVVHTHDYDSITGKPTTFAPAAHNHTITNVTGLQAALDDKASTADLNGKANAVHSHTYDSITGKPTSFTPAAHVHTIANVTGLQAELDGKAPTAHNHTIANVTGLQASLDGKAATVHTQIMIPSQESHNLCTCCPQSRHNGCNRITGCI